ncbi:MAG: GGDEF domain-containing protein [Deltaproteobacteria bacterium]|nr:GGDEF domain-containing protein [Deltaproteobacteria bacterium]
MFNLLAEGLVINGALILTAALFRVRRLVTQLPSSHVRRQWYGLTVLIIIFLLGYASYALAFWGFHRAWLDLIVPVIFFLGAVFVWLTATLSLQTAIDVRRVTILEYESITDPLIGIYNRRYLDRRLAEEYARAQRHALPLSILLLDIDFFKRINDVHGHQAGDAVLNYLGRLILTAVRASDIVARYGGEEILIITPHTTTVAAAELAERLRQYVESHELVLTGETGQQKIRITVSIGVASPTLDMNDCQCLVEGADRALYQAKEEGRNRISVYDTTRAKPATLAA